MLFALYMLTLALSICILDFIKLMLDISKISKHSLLKILKSKDLTK